VAKTLLTHFLRLIKGEGVEAKLKEETKRIFGPNPRPMPDGPNASGWYGRLRELKLTLLVFNDDVESLGHLSRSRKRCILLISINLNCIQNLSHPKKMEQKISLKIFTNC